ncbi:FkbM family methyltransferase [Pyrinomonas methylaliphatogenes]|uniref:Methyltransferase, FkbM family n=1 Tax=Pyrinomonas methylaliphatogenes TaxID=454194 RepID=A0A0B6WZU7_9BACT|nr:FkbM family methyltransferase [Pyrinomonas methylaliphatogenes]CDM66247.1 methyltransferase, FkbM family [Pyrinomonas methylaliphatogenes]
MKATTRKVKLPLMAKLIRWYLRSGLRGSYRVTILLAHKCKCLQAVPVNIADWSPLYIDLRDASLHEWLQGAPWDSCPREIDEQKVICRIVKEGDKVFDIGANIGLYTLLLSKLVGPRGRVYSFEPNLDLLPILSRTVEEAGNAELYPFALSNQSSETVLFVPKDHSTASLVNWAEIFKDVKEIVCKQVRLDDLVSDGTIPLPDFVKCDVEGAELMVFEGGVQTLNREDAPIILFEANVHTTRGFGLTVSSAKEFLEGMSSARFKFFEIQEGGRLSPIEKPHPIHSNILAVPQAKMARLGKSF